MGPKTAAMTARVPVSTSVISSTWGYPPCGHRPSQPRLRSLSGTLIELQPSNDTVRYGPNRTPGMVGRATGPGPPADNARTVLNGMLTILIDPARLGTADAFAREAMAFVEWLQQSPAAPGSDGVQLAGDPERAARKERTRTGIAIDDATWAEIGAAGAKVGVAA